MKICSYAILIFLAFTAPAFATVAISTPTSGQTVGSPVPFVATGTSTCSWGVASMGVYVNNVLKYIGTGGSLNTVVGLDPGTYNAVVIEWDNCGGSTAASRTIQVAGQTGVFVTTPANNSTVGSPADFVATATTGTCGQGVAAMGVYVDNALKYVVAGAKLNTQVSLGAGTHTTAVQEWDYCGGSTTARANINVSGGGNVLSNLQAIGGWNNWGELPPTMDICSSCNGVAWSYTQHVGSPSLSGNATVYWLGGTTPYSAALFSNPVIGQGSTTGLPDNNHTLLPTVHNLTYDADVYVTNAAITQSLEFDVNMYMNSAGMEWGTQCNHLGDGDWDLWDNVNARWVSTGAACQLNNGWNHVTIQAQRQPNNDLLYQSITWNGVTITLNKTYAPFWVPGGWWGITVNYQMDGDHRENANTTYVDNFNLTYW